MEKISKEGINNEILFQYFDFGYSWKNGKLSISVLLKKQFIENKKPLFKICKDLIKRPVSGAEEKYFVNYLGNEIGKKVFAERRKLFAKTKLIRWYVEVFSPADSTKLLDYEKAICKKISNVLFEYYHTESDRLIITKQKYRERDERCAKVNGRINSEKIKNDPEYREYRRKKFADSCGPEKISKARKDKFANDSEFREKMKKAWNTPERRAKRSAATKKMWENAKNENGDKFKSMMTFRYKKTFELDGCRMNSIEYLVGMFLNEINIDWEYEKFFKFEKSKKAFIPDFFIKSKNIIIECYGDFWHANPLLFSENDILFKKIIVGEKWKIDLERKDLFESNGFEYLIFWESEIHNNFEQVKKDITNAICRRRDNNI